MELFKGFNALFFLVFVTLIFFAAERFVPWRVIKTDPARWLRNISMNFYGIIILGLLPILSDVGIAEYARANGAGVLNNITLPLWSGILLTLIAADLTAFFQHRALHKWYFLWRLHRAHHTDATIDVTTGLRFHPLETVFRAATEGIVILALGLPVEGVLLVYGVFVVTNSIGHANLKLPRSAEKAASLIFIPPRAHRLHHATAPHFYNSNFGTIFSWWDRLSGTWTEVDKLDDAQAFGLDGAEAMEADTFGNLALDPFRKLPGDS